ncbi:MAG TPA: tetratricopeptide repeat protein [Pyrinomonadaceae bacterium]|jgi:tetratricopeptide (TPR) repeat protein|nr:tetratricopeptide repeat protein [Pyrinomonadaceae bacterium]
MSRENLLFAIIGVLLGFIVGFMFASSMSQKQAMQQQTAAASQSLPADHPPVGAQNAPNPQAMQAEVTASLEKARNEPKNFEAQMKAAQLYYQIQRFDQSIEYLLKANQLRPTDYQTVVTLGMVNLDAGHYDTAEKWYRAAMKMKSDDVTVLAGLAASTLARGDAKAAEDAIAQLEKVDPNSQDLPNFRNQLASLKAGK